MKFNNLFLSIVSCTFLFQTLCSMRSTPRISMPVGVGSATKITQMPQIITPETTATPEAIQQFAQEFQAEQKAQATSWMRQKKQRLNLNLQKPFIPQELPKEVTEQPQAKTEEPRQQSSKKNFWDSAYKNIKTGAAVTGLAGTAGSVGYGYQQHQQATQAKEDAQQNLQQLKEDFQSLEMTINRFDKDQTKWTDYHKNIFARYLSLYNYLLQTLTAEELVTEYVQLKNQLIAIEEFNFKNLWKQQLASLERNWMESSESYQNRKAQNIDEYQQAFMENEALKNRHIKDILFAENNSTDQLKANIKRIKPTVVLQKYKIKSLPRYVPEQTAKKANYSIKLNLPELPTAVKANLYENNY